MTQKSVLALSASSFPNSLCLKNKNMVVPEFNYEEFADSLEKSLDMFGIDDAFKFFGVSRKEWIFKMTHESGKKNEWCVTKKGEILMPNLGIY